MTAPRITAEDISKRRSYAAIGAVYDKAPALVVAILARMVREDMDTLESAYAELDRLSAQGGEVPKEVVPADLWAIYWSPGCWDLHESREEAEAVARSGICELVPLWRSPAPPHPDTVEVSRGDYEYLQLCEAVATTKPRAGCEDFALRWNTWVAAANLMWELVAKRDAIRAQAQPATERSI